ncbi:MAG: hypothetical protein IJS56_00905 [Bacilli bacterium]|nr:hypothetical protein [Bacilli bacterium]
MRRKNAFVLAETLIVVLLLTITLMSLYTTFSAIVLKTKNRTNNDTIDTIYKTTFVKDLLDNYYLNAKTGTSYTDSFSYYASVNTKICDVYDYNGSKSRFLNNGEQIIICNFESYHNTSEKVDNDPLYDIVKSYSIDKIYLVNFGNLNTNAAYNLLDASTIDYSLGKAKKLVGDYMVVKYKKTYVYPVDYDRVVDFDPDFEVYHSSIRLNTIQRNESAAPILLYEDATSNETPAETQLLEDNDQYQLLSQNNFTHHPGQVIIGWVNDEAKDLYGTYDGFQSCLNNKASLDENIMCEKVGTVIRVKSYTRKLYAIWCGDGKLSTAIECQIQSNDPSSKNGAFNDRHEGYNETNIVYRGTGGDNFVRIGDYCYSLVSTFGSTDSIKTLFYGAYDKTKNECNSKTNMAPEAASSFNSGFNYLSYAWMFNKQGTSSGLGNDEELKAKTGLIEIVSEPAKSSTPCPYNSYCYFGSKVVYDQDTHKYTILNEDNSPVTEKINFASFEASNYAGLKDEKFVHKYVCPGGQTTTCDNEIYYYVGVTSDNYTKFYKIKNGLNYNDISNKQLIASKSVSYSNGIYTLKTDSPDDYITFTISEYNNASADLNRKLRTYKYMCDGDLLKREDNSKYTCSTLLFVLNRYNSGTVLKLTGGMTTQDEYDKDLIGTLSNRNTSSNIKNKIDTFYNENLKPYEKYLDSNATFCNDLTETVNMNLNNLPTNSFYMTNQFSTYSNGNSANGQYKNCDDEGQFLYSKHGSLLGNQLMDNPIGLLTYEEFTYVAGGNNVSSTSYLAGIYYLMNPSYMKTSTDSLFSYGYYVYSTTTREDANGNSTSNRIIRPVISIKLDSIISKGTGSYNNPFVLG